MPASLNLDDLIRRVLSVAVEDGDRDYLKDCVPGSEFVNLCHAVKKVLLQQPSMIEVEPPITVVGDIHGQFRDLVRIFNRCGYPPQTNYLFLGDYVDRGKQSLETACLLFAYKLKYPENFFLLRGNHECAPVNKVYGFYEECARRYNVRLWQIIQDVFNCLPFTGLISGRIICMHGGLSPHLRNWQQLRNIRRPLDPVEPLHTDLLWSDPDNFISGWGKSPRGISGVFGADVVQDFCARMEVDLIVRAHQVVQDGYELFANRRLVTIFSAPRYCGTFDNAGGMMTVSEDLTCAFHILKPALKPLRITSS